MSNIGIAFTLASRNVTIKETQADIGELPLHEIVGAGGGTQVTLWPGIATIDGAPYSMTAVYEDQDFCSDFGDGQIIFCTEDIVAADVDRTVFSQHQSFDYSVTLPAGKPLLWGLPNPFNQVTVYHNADETEQIPSNPKSSWIVRHLKVWGRSVVLHWHFVLMSGDPAYQVEFHYSQRLKARLIAAFSSVGSAFLGAVVGHFAIDLLNRALILLHNLPMPTSTPTP